MTSGENNRFGLCKEYFKRLRMIVFKTIGKSDDIGDEKFRYYRYY